MNNAGMMGYTIENDRESDISVELDELFCSYAFIIIACDRPVKFLGDAASQELVTKGYLSIKDGFLVATQKGYDWYNKR